MKFQEALKEAVKHLSSPEFRQRVKEEDERMLSEIDILCEINKKGFLTHDSQSGRKEKGKHYLDKKPYTIDERAYIAGFMLRSKAAAFLEKIHLHTDKMAFVVPSVDCTLDIPTEFDIPLTIQTHSGQKEIISHMSPAVPQDYKSFQLKQSKINKSEPVVYVYCFDPQWNRYSSSRAGLFKDVLRCL